MTCCSASATLGSISSPYTVLPGTTWQARLRFYRVGVRVVVWDADDPEPEDGDPINLSSPARTGTAELRPSTEHTGDPVAALSVSIDTPQSGQRRGRVTVTLAAADSAYPQMTPRLYCFDVRLDDGAGDVLGSPVFWVSVMEGATRA
jgi:hypothetical protein